MNVRRQNQAGYGVLEFFLIFLVLALAGVLGVMIWSQSSTFNFGQIAETTSASSQRAKKITSDEELDEAHQKVLSIDDGSAIESQLEKETNF